MEKDEIREIPTQNNAKTRGQTVARGGNVMHQAQHHWAWLWASPPLTDWPEDGLLYGPSLCVVCARRS